MRILAISSLTALLLLNYCILRANGALKRVECDQVKEYLCKVDNKCILRSQVCNFFRDCSDGADESLCGACSFERNPKKCGLKFVSDRLYGWHRRTPSTNDVFLHQEHQLLNTHNGSSKPDYYMRLDLNKTMLQLITRHFNDQKTIYRPKILFPHLRPTNNKLCRFSFQMLITKVPGRVSNKFREIVSHRDSSWPKVDFVLVQPKELNQLTDGFTIGRLNREYKSFDLKTKNKKQRGTWYTYEVLLGARQTVWTLEIQIETRVRSYLTYFSNFNYIDCQPLPEEPIEETLTELPLDLDDIEASCNEKTEFKCKFSGICIDISLRCDFNYDCGDDDVSDEDQCDHYPGRCDFETENLCHWLLGPTKNSWFWVSVSEETQIFYGKLPRPLVDHTYKSKLLGGQYLMIRSELLKSSSSFQMFGPKVDLLDDFDECSIRFWIFTTPDGDLPSNVLNSLKFPYLDVAYDRISAKELFSPDLNSRDPNEKIDDMFGLKSSSNFGWKRINVKLLDRNNNNNRSINAIKIALENFADQVDIFTKNNLVFAIDDISFTPGCKLIERGTANPDGDCGSHEYQCKVPTPITGANCIPINYYCDFKNDCGLHTGGDSKGFELADDELNCPRKCVFSSKDQEHCGIDVLDGQALRMRGDIDDSLALNEAFNWLIVDTNDLDGHLAIVSNFETFMTNYKRQQDTGAEPLEVNQYNLKTLRLELPTFSVSHSNCQFEMFYKWTQDSNNIHASILLSSDATGDFDQDILIKKLNVPETMKNSTQMQTIKVGIGHQAKPFKVAIEVALEGDMMSTISNKPSGSLLIFSYQFITCSFYPGLINTKRQVEFADELENMTNEIEGQREMFELESYKSALDESCTEEFFQCQDPVVCIPKSLKCDKQLDCQGGKDEEDCKECTGFDFDDQSEDEFRQKILWWNQDNRQQSCGLQWIRNQGSSFMDRTLDSGPPFDHSKSNKEGWYLNIQNFSIKNHQELSLLKPELRDAACLMSPRFKATSKGCRFIVYIYFWGQNKYLNKFEILLNTKDVERETTLYEISADNYATNSTNFVYVDHWQRIELEIEPSEDELSIVILGYVGANKSGLIGVDDIIFSPECKFSPLSNSQSSRRHSIDDTNVKIHSKVISTVLTILIAIILVTTVITIYLVRNSSRSHNWLMFMGPKYTRFGGYKGKSTRNLLGVNHKTDLGAEEVELSRRKDDNSENLSPSSSPTFDYRRLSTSGESSSYLTNNKESD